LKIRFVTNPFCMRYFVFKAGATPQLVASFAKLSDANRFYVMDTALENIEDWVEEYGMYVSNAIDFDTSGHVDVVMDTAFEVPEDSTDYEAQLYCSYRVTLDRLLENELVSQRG
jgi:hypothetical protein